MGDVRSEKMDMYGDSWNDRRTSCGCLYRYWSLSMLDSVEEENKRASLLLRCALAIVSFM